MKFLEASKQIFIDSTFKCSPKDFYQVINILVKPNDYNHIIPICHVLMTNKSYISYINIINDLKLQLFLNQIKVDCTNIYFIHDFDKGLVKAIEEYFSNSKSIVCCYHYCKSLWIYAKKHQIYIKKK